MEDLAYRFSNYGVKNFLKWLSSGQTKMSCKRQCLYVFKQVLEKVAVIIDCFKIFIDKSSNLSACASTWSNYKHHNTAKVLLGISPLLFVSEWWGGWVSDKCFEEIVTRWHSTGRQRLWYNRTNYNDAGSTPHSCCYHSCQQWKWNVQEKLLCKNSFGTRDWLCLSKVWNIARYTSDWLVSKRLGKTLLLIMYVFLLYLFNNHMYVCQYLYNFTYAWSHIPQ